MYFCAPKALDPAASECTPMTEFGWKTFDNHHRHHHYKRHHVDDHYFLCCHWLLLLVLLFCYCCCRCFCTVGVNVNWCSSCELYAIVVNALVLLHRIFAPLSYTPRPWPFANTHTRCPVFCSYPQFRLHHLQTGPSLCQRPNNVTTPYRPLLS